MSASPSGSLDAAPLSVATAPRKTDWSEPASADGARFSAVTTTVSGALSWKPSLTMSWATYWPARSMVNQGDGAIASLSNAALPAGTDSSDQR